MGVLAHIWAQKPQKPFLADVMSHPENSPSGASGIFPAKAPLGIPKFFVILSGGQSGADSYYRVNG